jgi:DNA-binding MarR family transcriptional regulator
MIGRTVRQPVLSWLYLARIFSRLDRMHNRVLADRGLSHAQFDVLSQLNANPGISQQALAERLLVTKGNICGLIDRLEREGCVERRSNAIDRRVNDLHLTEHGRTLYRDAFPKVESAIAEAFDALDPAELSSLRSLLRRLDRDQRLGKHAGQTNGNVVS